MRKLCGASGLLALALIGLAVAAGCGGGEEAADEQAGAGTEAAPAVDPATAATLTGSVSFSGTAPAAQPIDMSEEPTCADKHPGGARTERVVVNANGTLKNVFVYVKEGLSGSFPAPQQGVTIDQNGCIYEPHVLGLQINQQLVIKNSDGLLHNINAKPSANRGFNISQPTNMESKRTFATREVMIPVECDVHGWMTAYIGVLDHPYFAVTGDDGAFSIGNLPPGNYVVEAWHEQYGTQTMNVTVAASETKDVRFSFSSSMASAHVPLGQPLVLHRHSASR